MDELERYVRAKKKRLNTKLEAAEKHKCRRCEWLSHYYLKDNNDAVFKCMFPRCIK